MDFDRLILFFTIFSPACFFILAISKVWLRLAFFLPLATFPPALLLYVGLGSVHPYAGGAYIVISIILSLLFSLLGLGLIVKAEQKTRAFYISILGTLVASIPVAITLVSFVGGAIYQKIIE